MSTAETFLRDIAAAADTFDRRAATLLCDEFVDAVTLRGLEITGAQAGKALGVLRRKRYFALAESVGAAFLRSGVTEPVVWRQYAQALIEGRKLASALAVLARLVSTTSTFDRGACDSSASLRENAEAHGLTGRAYKQHYVDTAGSDPYRHQALIQAIAEYATVFDADKSKLWHGINMVALACRAAEDHVRLPMPFNAGDESRRILRAVVEKGAEADAWDCATAMEACIAIADWSAATKWASRYVAHPEADAFEIASTLRQLTEVWRLDPSSDDAGPVVLLLKAHLLRREGGEVAVGRSELTSGQLQSFGGILEARLGGEEMIPLELLMKGFERCSGVVKIGPTGGGGFGTGFVVRGGDLCENLDDELLVLTNAHVVSDDLKVHERFSQRPPLRPEAACVHFQITDETFRVRDTVWSSPPEKLDASLLRLDRPLRRGSACPLERTGISPAYAHKRVYVIGHPGGRGLTFSLSDNVVLDFNAPKLHYRAPTEGGSSGSPVFTADWDVLALHHAGGEEMPRLHGGGTYAANEGIWIESIRRSLAKTKSRRPVRPVRARRAGRPARRRRHA